jgi:hypothetical protein
VRDTIEADGLRQLSHLLIELTQADIKPHGRIDADVTDESLRPAAYRFDHLLA